jgi:hypothetical protein
VATPPADVPWAIGTIASNRDEHHTFSQKLHHFSATTEFPEHMPIGLPKHAEMWQCDGLQALSQRFQQCSDKAIELDAIPGMGGLHASHWFRS